MAIITKTVIEIVFAVIVIGGAIATAIAYNDYVPTPTPSLIPNIKSNPFSRVLNVAITSPPQSKKPYVTTPGIEKANTTPAKNMANILK